MGNDKLPPQVQRVSQLASFGGGQIFNQRRSSVKLLGFKGLSLNCVPLADTFRTFFLAPIAEMRANFNKVHQKFPDLCCIKSPDIFTFSVA